MSVRRNVIDDVGEYVPAHDTHLLSVGFCYELTQWRRWTSETILMKSGECLRRAEYVYYFVDCIIGTLNARGYAFLHSTDSIARRFMHHWLHIATRGCSRLPLPKCATTQEEYEDWNSTFMEDFWLNVISEYDAYGCFDNSVVGEQLFRDLCQFFWIYVDPNKSERIQQMRRISANADDGCGDYYGDSEAGSGAAAAALAKKRAEGDT